MKSLIELHRKFFNNSWIAWGLACRRIIPLTIRGAMLSEYLISAMVSRRITFACNNS